MEAETGLCCAAVGPASPVTKRGALPDPGDSSEGGGFRQRSLADGCHLRIAALLPSVLDYNRAWQQVVHGDGEENRDGQRND